MKGKNCPNCGAVYILEDVKCPYCGTLYYDLSAIDFTQDQPVFLKFRIPYGNSYADITQCAIPMLDSIEVNNEYISSTNYLGKTIATFCTGRTATTNVQFQAVPYGNNYNLYEIKVKE